ncbi:MAG: right-handed parallel beta-helix repeat-containing protein, partial [Ginsengibacter sp.]
QLVGGKEIKGFGAITDVDVLKRIKIEFQKKILQLNLKSIGISNYGTITKRGRPGLELFFNGEKMTLARWPNVGWDTIADVPQNGEVVFAGDSNHIKNGLPIGRHYGRIGYNGDRPANWSNAQNIFLYGYWVWDWHDEFLQVKSIDTIKKEITIKPPHSSYGYIKGARYYAVNVLEELDQPGEWYLNRDDGSLYFWPPAPIESGKTFVSLLDKPVIEIEGANNVHIEGLDIEFSRGNGIVMRGGENNLIAGCNFNNLGDIAVRIEGGFKNGISSCDIFNVAAGGIILSGGDRKSLTPAGNFAVNNHIHHFGQWLKTHQSAISLGGVGNYVAHNLIHDGPNSGIQLSGNEHILEYNELHHLGQETADVGAFYMGRNWTQRGNVIRYNYFHDLNGPGQNYVNGVYLDDFSSGTTIHGNIFARSSKGIEIGGGRDNIVSNNLFVECKLGISVDARGIGWAKYYFTGNDNTLFEGMDRVNYKQPPYSVKYPILLSLYNDEPAMPKNNKIINNISYKGKWIDLLDRLDFKTVLCSNNIVSEPDGKYKNEKDHVVNGNPGIINNKDGSFKLSADALKFGFKPLPFNRMGLMKDAYRKEVITPKFED